MSLLPSGAIETGGYNINNSLRFRSNASAYLSRTPASAGNRTTWTWSCWVKKTPLASGVQAMIAAGVSTTVYDDFCFENDQIRVVFNNGTYDVRTTQVFRDPSAWYHVILAMDTTQATSSNRVKIYVNGTQVTAFATANYPVQNHNTNINNNILNNIGNLYNGSFSSYFDGYLAEVNFIDGQALTPSSFGETDAVTGVWKPKKYTGTYGTNGFYLPFKSYTDTAYAGQFNGSTQYLTVAGNTAFDLTGDFTIESWINPSSLPNPTGIWSLQPASGGAGIRCTYEGQLLVALISGVGTLHAQLSGPVLTANNWYHVAVTRSGSALKLFVNGCVVATQTTSNWTGTSSPCMIGAARNYASGAMFYYTGYQSNFRIVKGTALYTSNFVPPVTSLTNISGTSILTLQNSSAIDNSSNSFTITNNGTTTFPAGNVIFNANLLADASLTGNLWTPNNLNYSFYGTTYDAMTDVPTNTSATVGNYCTINPLLDLQTYATYSEGNLKVSTTASAGYAMRMQSKGTMAIPSSGKWYFAANASDCGIGMANDDPNRTQYGASILTTHVRYQSSGDVLLNGSVYATVASFTSTDEVGLAIDMDALTVGIYKNGSLLTTVTGVTSGFTYYPMTIVSSSSTAYTAYWNFGQRPFAYTPPSGYKTLNTFNLPDSTIKKGNSYMDATTYTGNGYPTSGTQSITNAGAFKPDLVWIKIRSGAGSNTLTDSVRGVNSQLFSNQTAAQETNTDHVTAFNSNGFSLGTGTSGTYPSTNNNGSTYVGWQWQAGQGSTSSNTAGSITSTVSVNTTAGFSIVTFTSNNTGGATVGHGLGIKPSMIILKRRGGVSDWDSYHTSLGATKGIGLNTTSAATTSINYWNNTEPTSSVFTLGAGVNPASITMVAYCWAEIAGYSKFGSYTGNGSADGTFIYTGFLPKFIMIKCTDTAGTAWVTYDTSRDTYNQMTNILLPNSSSAELSGYSLDVLSNGFKHRQGGGDPNATSRNYIYACFASNPFKNSLAR